MIFIIIVFMALRYPKVCCSKREMMMMMIRRNLKFVFVDVDSWHFYANPRFTCVGQFLRKTRKN